ncbi:MAG: hypothetical protein C4320_02480 [Armatimonadota bacterium]
MPTPSIKVLGEGIVPNRMNHRLSVAVFFAAVGCFALADRTIAPSGKTAPVLAKTIRPTTYVPMVDLNLDRPRFIQPENEARWQYGSGEPNGLNVGGLLGEGRVGTSRSTFFPTNGATGYEPPDPDLAVGKNAVVVVVNDTIGFYSKSGSRLFLQSFGNFFAPVNPTPFLFDPKVNYDPGTGRFYAVVLNQDEASKTSSFMIAVSAGEDVLQPWKLYKVNNTETVDGGAHWLDYPGWGFNSDSIVASGNMFPFDGQSGGVYTSVFAFKKSDLIAGTAQAVRFTMDDFSLQVAKTNGTGTYTYAVSTQSQTSMNLYALKTGANPLLTQATVPVPRWFGQGSITDAGGHVTGGFDPRTLNAAFRNGRLVATQAVGISANDSRGAARWYDFAIGTWPVSGAPRLAQSGQINPPGNSAYLFPAINIDPFGNYGMTFSKIDPASGYFVMASGRKPSDPVGLMGRPSVLETGLSRIYRGFSSRWGDYHDLECDPSDPLAFWAVGMAPDGDGRWLTFAKSFVIGSGADIATQLDALDAATLNGRITAGNNQSLWNKDGVPLVIASETVAGIGRAAGVKSNFTSPVLGADLLFFRATVKAAGPDSGTITLFLRNVMTGAMDPVASFPANSDRDIDLPPATAAKYIGGNGEIFAGVRCVLPPRNGKSPSPFDLRVDKFGFGVIAKPTD